MLVEAIVSLYPQSHMEKGDGSVNLSIICKTNLKFLLSGSPQDKLFQLDCLILNSMIY